MAQWRELKLASGQKTRNYMNNTLIHHHNSPWCDIHKQAFFFLLLCKFMVFFTPQLRHSLFSHLLLRVISQEWRRNEEKWRIFAKWEERESNPCKSSNISSNAHNESSYLSLHYRRIQECNKEEKNSRFIAKTCNLHLTQALSTHSLTRLDLARMPSQEGGSSLKSLPVHI